jgi:hypothetical protein
MIRALARVILAAAALGALPACDVEPGGMCGTTDLRPATGTGALQGASLAPGASEQKVTISPDRKRLEYTFTKGGKTYTAVYALSETEAPRALRHVSIRRPAGALDCAALEQKGPVFDGIEIRRGGRLLGGGERPQRLPVPCSSTMQPEDGPDVLGGPPDGEGASLGRFGFGWTVPQGLALLPGDEIYFTVLDGAAEPYGVYLDADADYRFRGVELGTLTGSGTLRVP